MRRGFEWIADHPLIALGVISLVTVGFLIFIPSLTTDTDFSNYIDKDDPALRAMERAEGRYGDQSLLLIAVENDEGIFNVKTLTKIDRLQRRLEVIRGVDGITGPLNAQVVTGTATEIRVGPAAPDGAVPATPEALDAYRKRVLGSNTLRDYIVSSDGLAATLSIKLRPDADRIAVAKEVVEIVGEENTPPERIYIAGLSYMNVVLAGSMVKDLRVLLPLVILMIVCVLYGSFRSLRGVLLPLLVVSLSTVWALGLMAIFAIPVTIISFILPVILIAIGIAYGIHVLNRYYEEIDSGVDRRTAVVETGLRMVAPVSMAGLTTMAGFLSLLNSLLIPQRQFGLFAAAGVLAAMILSLVLIPAFLSLLSVPKRPVMKKKRGLSEWVFSFLERLVIHHRKAILVFSVALLGGFLAGLPFLQIETSQREFLGGESPVVQAMDAMARHFSGSEQLMIEIDTGEEGGLKEPKVLEQISALQEFLKTQGVRKTIALPDMIREMNQKFHADDPAYFVVPDSRKVISELLFLSTGNLGNMALGNYSAGEVMGLYPLESSAKQVALVRAIEDYLKRHFTGSVRAEMVGPTRVQSRLFSQIALSQLKSLGTSILAAGLIVVFLMSSLVAGLVSLIPLILTVAVNFGVMAYSGTPLNMATLMVSSIAIGIGIDYAIHFISRFRREVALGGSTEQALGITLRTTGRGIAANALALALGFIVLLVSSFKGTREFGLLIAMTMVISATSAFTIIPAILIVWKPRFLTRPDRMRFRNTVTK